MFHTKHDIHNCVYYANSVQMIINPRFPPIFKNQKRSLCLIVTKSAAFFLKIGPSKGKGRYGNNDPESIPARPVNRRRRDIYYIVQKTGEAKLPLKRLNSGPRTKGHCLPVCRTPRRVHGKCHAWNLIELDFG